MKLSFTYCHVLQKCRDWSVMHFFLALLLWIPLQSPNLQRMNPSPAFQPSLPSVCVLFSLDLSDILTNHISLRPGRWYNFRVIGQRVVQDPQEVSWGDLSRIHGPSVCRDRSGTCITAGTIRGSRDPFQIHPPPNGISTISPTRDDGGETRRSICCRRSGREISRICGNEHVYREWSALSRNEFAWLLTSRFSKIAEERPLDILNHCYKHGYDELADQVALHTITFRLPVVAAKLTYPGLLQKWVRFIFSLSFIFWWPHSYP